MAIELAPDFELQQKKRMRTVAKFFWVVSMIATVGGGALCALGILAANGAPQEAAAAAIGCLIVIGPYALARAVDELTR